MSLPEIRVLVAAARAAGVPRILLTHPDLELSGIGVADQKALADAGAILEKDVNTLGPLWHSTTPEAMIHSIREVGPARCVLATDYGQLHRPAPAEDMRIFVQLCLEQGLSGADVRTMVVDNPARLLGLG
jgi:predicted metal-dependent phosphotriesterase family hydrolase